MKVAGYKYDQSTKILTVDIDDGHTYELDLVEEEKWLANASKQEIEGWQGQKRIDLYKKINECFEKTGTTIPEYQLVLEAIADAKKRAQASVV